MQPNTLQGLKPAVLLVWSTFYQLLKRHGFDAILISGLRTNEAQTALYAQGRTTPGPIVTNAKAGQSMHNYGIAFDINITNIRQRNIDWPTIGALGKGIGLTWGGDFTTISDLDHFELLQGYTETQIMKGQVDWTKWNVPSHTG